MNMKRMELSEFKDRIAARSITRRQMHKVLASVGVVTVSTPLLSQPAAAESTIQVFTWSGYDVEQMRPGFDAMYGAPGYLLFADNDEAIEKVRAGYAPTLAQPTSYLIGRWRDAGLIKQIDTSRLSNWDNVFDQLKTITGISYEGETWGAPLAWGNSSVLYRKDLAPEYVGNDSWGILWDPKYSGRLAQRDSVDAGFLEAALILGIENPYQMSDADLERCRAYLVEQRPLLRYYWSSQSDVEQSLASGEIVAAYAWNDAYASLKRQGYDVGYMIPKEGILTWVDSTIMIENGPGDEQEAYDYLNATLSPETGVFMIEEYGYGSVNRVAFETANQELLVELGIEDPDKVMALGVFFDEWDPEVREKASNMWEELKAGF
ncbi:MAG: extracellular solute-binding protein [Proteobacteria bacterium]|nr:extracellular solute-binding protein [Pseudomonadota bacterium]